MLRLAILTIFLLGSSLASPVEQIGDADTDSGIKAIFSMFSQLSGIVQKTGSFISRLNEKYTIVPELAQAGRKISQAGENLPSDLKVIVQDNFQKLLELLPSIKHNITEAMHNLPGIKRMISENIVKLASSEAIKQNVQVIFDILPEHAIVANIKSTFEDHVDQLPSKEYIDDKIEMALHSIPSADIVNSMVDAFVDKITPIVEELNETGGRK